MSLFHITVPAQRTRLVYRDGALSAVLPSGRHRRPRRSRSVDVDLRERLTVTAPQEVPTTDGLVLRVTVALRWRVGDPARFHEVSEDPQQTLYLAAQIVARDAVAGLTLDDVVRRTASVSTASLAEVLSEQAAHVGVQVLQVIVKDVVVPREVRTAALELATARQRGQARLEEARAETAALRSLANGAQLLDRHPALAQLRLVQALPVGSRVTLTVGAVPDGAPSDADD